MGIILRLCVSLPFGCKLLIFISLPDDEVLMRYFLLLTVCFLASCSAMSDAEVERINSAGAGMAQLGTQLQEKGELGGAMDFYHRSLARDPANYVAITGLATATQSWGDQKRAADVYAAGIKARPEDARLRKLYGKLLIKIDRPIVAERQFAAALSIDEDDMKARSGMAVALDYQGRHVAARKHYSQALKQDSGNLSIINNMAYSYILSHRYARAIELLESVAMLPKASVALRKNLSLAYGLAGMEMDARRIASMDSPKDKVEEAMNYYRSQRAENAVSNGAYAELGTYATEAMAMAQLHRLKPSVRRAGGKMKAVILPEVSAPGGTPRFAVRMMGCARPDDVSRLCKILAAKGVPCVARGKGGE